MGKDWVTKLAIMIITLAAIYYLKIQAKDVVIAAVAGLVGHLNGKGDSNPTPKEDKE